MVEDRLLGVLSDPVGVSVARAGDPVDQPAGAVGLEVTADLVELPAALADDAAGLADVAELAGKLEQSELAPCYLLLLGHVVLRSRLDVLHYTILTPAGSGVTTPGVAALGPPAPPFATPGVAQSVRSIPVSVKTSQIQATPLSSSLFASASIVIVSNAAPQIALISALNIG